MAEHPRNNRSISGMSLYNYVLPLLTLVAPQLKADWSLIQISLKSQISRTLHTRKLW